MLHILSLILALALQGVKVFSIPGKTTIDEEVM